MQVTNTIQNIGIDERTRIKLPEQFCRAWVNKEINERCGEGFAQLTN